MMKKIYRLLFQEKYFIDVMLLIFLGLIPLLWYTSPTSLIMGHDTGWSLVPGERFLDRFSTWTGFEFGSDQSLVVGSVTIYLLPALLDFLGLSIFSIQKITYVFWFFCIGLSMYIFVVSVLRIRYVRMIALLSALFYAVNHYTLQAWTVAELSKFSIMILFPVTLSLLWCVFEKRIRLVRAVIIFGFVSLFFNGGGGSGIPLYAGMLLSLVLLFIFKLFTQKNTFLLLVKTYAVFAIVFILVNAYWLVPLGTVIQSQYSPFASAGGAGGAVAWTNVISGNTSITNLLRLQGFSSWYDSPDHSFAFLYLESPLLIAGSYIFGVLAIVSLLLARNKKENGVILFLFIVFVFSLIFVGGTHQPFGFIYEWLMKNMFGFAIFRTAFYKFGYALWFTTGILSSYTVISLFTRLGKKAVIIGFLCFSGFVLFYHNQYFTGTFFNILGDFSTRIDLSTHILSSKDFAKTLSPNARILLAPPPSPVNGQTDIYNNGYFSRTPLPLQISQKSIVSNRESNTLSQETLTESFYKEVRNGNYDTARKLASEMGITHILLRRDVLLNHNIYRVENPKEYENYFKEINWLTKEKDFGDWIFYKIEEPGSVISVVNPNINFISGEESVYIKNFKFDQSRIFTTTHYKELFPNKKSFSTVLISECSTCDYPGVRRLPTAEDVKILPTSPLYFVSSMREKKNIENSKVDEFLHFGYLYYYAEKHSVEVALLASQYYDVDTLKLDQQQRHDIVKRYIETLSRSYDSYKKLSHERKLTVVSEYKASLESQRERLRESRQSNFFNEIFPLYYESYAKINDILNSSSLKSVLLEQNSVNTYRFDIPFDAKYSIDTSIDGESYLLNSDIVDIHAQLALSKGEHVLQEEKNEEVIYSFDKIELTDEKNIFEITLNDLKPSELYGIEFAYHIERGPAMRAEIVNDIGDRVVSLIFQQSGNSYWIPFSNHFTTSNYVGGPYRIRFYAEGEEDLFGHVYLENVKIKILKLPYAIISQTEENVDTVLPSISVENINSSSFIIKVKNARDPFVLNFKQTFSPFWNAKIIGESQRSIHFPYNLAFNGWYIDKNGDFEVEISYSVDKYYRVGLIVTCVSFSVLVALCAWLLIKRYGKKGKK